LDVLLYLSEAFIVAYVMRVLAYRFKIPSVTGYVIGGVILGGTMFHCIPGGRLFAENWMFTEDVLSKFTVIAQIALGFVALSIGIELEWKRLKNLGKSILFITFFEALASFIIVTLTTFLIWRNLPFSFILGAVSSATAPAATVAVIQQYRAKGPLTSTILAVVGIDDAISFIIFAFAFSVAKGNLRGEHVNLINAFMKPVMEIFIALLIGSVMGLLAGVFLAKTKEQENILFFMGAVILFVSGIASELNFSALLANMACGAILVNINPLVRDKIRKSFSSFMPIFYALFFIIGGAHLNISVFPAIWKIALVYFLCRSFGKSGGAAIGAIIGRAIPQVRRLIGFSLLPQVGAAIALALVIQQEFGSGDYGTAGLVLAQNTMNILLITTLLTEFIGPYLTKLSLFKAGEIRE